MTGVNTGDDFGTVERTDLGDVRAECRHGDYLRVWLDRDEAWAVSALSEHYRTTHGE